MSFALALRSCGRISGVLNQRTAKLCTLSNTYRTSALKELIKPALCPKTTVSTQLARNFSVTTPKASANHGDSHAALWTAERALSVGLMGVIPVALAFPSQGLDALMAVSIVMHQHWGLEAIVVDYVRPIIFGNVVPKVALGLLYLFSIATLGGLFYFIYNDIGIAKAIRKLWAVKGQ